MVFMSVHLLLFVDGHSLAFSRIRDPEVPKVDYTHELN